MTLGINKETIGSGLAVVLVILGGWYAFTHGPATGSGGLAAAGASDTVASVNGENIPRSSLTALMAQLSAQAPATTTEAKAALEKEALDIVVERTLLVQAAAQGGLAASTTAVNAQVEEAKQQLGGQDAFDQALLAQGMTEESFRTQIREGLAIDTYLEHELKLSLITASDAEIKIAYDQISAGQTDVPALSEVKDQMKQFVLAQKQQQLITAQVEKLRAAANIQLFI